MNCNIYNGYGPEDAHLLHVKRYLTDTISDVFHAYCGDYGTEYFQLNKGKNGLWELYESRESDCDSHHYIIDAKYFADALKTAMRFFGVIH